MFTFPHGSLCDINTVHMYIGMATGNTNIEDVHVAAVFL